MFKPFTNEQIISEIKKRGTASLILDRISTNNIIGVTIEFGNYSTLT